MTSLDLARVLSILLDAAPTAWRRRVVAHDVAELGDWIARHGRFPAFAWAGDRVENALALRLHAYLVHLAHADGIASPENPLFAARSDIRGPIRRLPRPSAERRRRVEEIRRKLMAEDVDQSHWPEGSI